MSQNGLLHDRQTSAMGMSLAAVAARALMTGFGYNVEQALRTLEARSAEYSREVSSGSSRDSGHDELAPMAAGMIQAALSGDSPTMGTIAREIKHLGLTPDEVAVTFAAIAGRMLAGTSGGRQSADFVTRSVVARRAGMLAS